MNELEEIKDKIDIVEYVGQYVPLKQSGRNFKGLCPFHNEKTPSFMVSPEKQIWHCFGCNEGGDVISFVEKIDGLSFPEAVRELAKKTGVKLPQGFTTQKEPNNKLYEINELICQIFEKALKSTEGEKANEYLLKRGLSNETIQAYRLGFSPSQGEKAVKELMDLGFNREDLVKAGVASMKNGRIIDQFRNRLIFPIANSQGKIIGFSGRVLDQSLPKYINTPETPVYHKSSILYGFDKAKEQIRKQNHVILVEGNMDVIFSYQAGVKNVAASSGTALTEAQLDLIKRFTKNIKISFDVDMAGVNATKRAIELAWEKNFNIKVIEIDEGKDPADLVKSDPKKWVNACKKAKYVVDYIFDSTFDKYDITNILNKKRATKELLSVISRLPDPIEREHYLSELSSRVGVSMQALVEALRRAKHPTKAREIESIKKEAKKPKSLEEHVFSLLLAYPRFVDFFFVKLKPEDFTAPQVREYVAEIKELNDNLGAFEVKKWLKTKNKNDREGLNKMIMKIEDEFTDADEDLIDEEIYTTAIRLKFLRIEKKKKELSNQIGEAEKAEKKEDLARFLSELQKLIEDERNL